jgi:hypothetical protein
VRTLILVVLMLALAAAAGLSFVLPAARGESVGAAPQHSPAVHDAAIPTQVVGQEVTLTGGPDLPMKDVACVAALSAAMGLSLRRSVLRRRRRSRTRTGRAPASRASLT